MKIDGLRKQICFSDYCSIEYWRSAPIRWFPILTWLPQYNFEDFKGDFIAGFTVGLTVVPQGLALAQLAGLPPQYGLYTAFMGSFMYTIFGTCKDLVIGPTSVMALMTAEHVYTGGPKYAVILTFLCGCIQLLFGILNLGFLVNFISAAVLSGFTSAAALIIATSQLKGLLGLNFKSRGFIENVYHLALNIPNTNFYDMVMGFSTVAALLLLRKFKDIKCMGLPSKFQNCMKTFWWCLATARNAVLVIVCSLVAFAFLCVEKDVFNLTQHVEAGLPPFAVPPLTMDYVDEEMNSTVYKDTVGVLKDLGSGAIIIPFMSLLEAIAIAKVFSKSKKLDATREMIALGMGNLMGSFVSSYPVTGSFSRTVINNSSGVRTPLGGIFTGAVVLLALGVIAPSFHYIPKACLCAIIFSAVIFMIHYEDVPAMWNTNRLELVPFTATFMFSIVLGLEYGLLFGVAISLGMLLFKQNRPYINISINKVDATRTYIHVTPDNCIYFPSIEYLKGKINKAVYGIENKSEIKIIIHGDRLTGIDYSTAMGIKSLAATMRKQNISVEFNVTEPSALKALNCLQDSIPFCKPHEELQDFSEAVTSGKKCHVQLHRELCELDSTEPLLNPSTILEDEQIVISVKDIAKKKKDFAGV